jgi:UDP-glucuronate decarboxylase
LNPIVLEDLIDITSRGLAFGELRGRTVLISGANGFLPAYMVETLLHLNTQAAQDAPARVIALVRNELKARKRFAHHLGRADLQFLVQDVCDPIHIPGPVDYVIHAASQASPKYYGTDPVGTLAANTLGTHRLLELAREKNSRGFLFFSSGEIYGHLNASQIPTAETEYGPLDPTALRSCYAEGKRAGEALCVAWHHQHRVPAKIVRPFHTYGPGMALDDGRVFSDFVADVVHDRDIVMKSRGEALRPYCYLSDAVEGFFRILFLGKEGTAYNLGNPAAEVTVAELAQKLVELFPEKGLKVVPSDEPPTAGYLKSPFHRTCPQIDRIRELGWNPRHTIESGFRRTVMSCLWKP